MQPPGALWDAVRSKWGYPGAIHCDRFRLPELLDVVPGRIPIIPRLQRWSEGSFDIRALRKITRDGPLAICQKSRALLRASLAVTCVKEDDAGSVRIIKSAARITRVGMMFQWLSRWPLALFKGRAAATSDGKLIMGSS